MSWSRIKATGRGKLEFRLVIEGLPYVFCSHPDMEQTAADGRQWVHCLEREGLVLEEDGDIATAEIEIGGMTVSLVDRQKDDALTKAFAYQPDVVTYMDGDHSAATTIINVLSTSGFTAGDVIHVGTEAIKIQTVLDSTTLTGGLRGYWDTIAQKHWGESGDRLRRPEVANRPTSIEGRRAYLYAYGDGDTLTGNGTKIWTGICLTDARLDDDACTWQVTIESLKSILDQDLGAELDEPTHPRGIYYPHTHALRVDIVESSSATHGGGDSGDRTNLYIAGFFETQEAFCEALTTKLAAATPDGGGSFNWTDPRAVPIGDRDWKIQYTGHATPRWINIVIQSAIDGNLNTLTRPETVIDTSTGLEATTIATGTVYDIRYGSSSDGVLTGLRTVPRGVYGADAPGADRGSLAAGSSEPVSDSDVAAYPPTKIYVGGRLEVGSLAALLIEADNGINETNHAPTINTQSSSERSVTFNDNGVREDGVSHAFSFRYTSTTLPRLRPVRRYATGTLYDLVNAITTDAPTYANKGSVPFITTSDVNVSGVQTTVNDAATKSYQQNRDWISAESVTLGELWAAEALLLGCFWRLGSDGKLELAQIKAPTATDPQTYTAGDDEILVDDGFPGWEKNAVGTVNVITVHTGFDAVEGEWTGTTYVVRDVKSISRRKASRKVEIKPPSRLLSRGTAATYEDIVALAQPILGLFGTDYAVVTIEVPFTLFDVKRGDTIFLTNTQIPDPETGTRGITAQPGIVLSRRWDLDQGAGMLRVLVSFGRFAGYAPSVSVSSATNTSGDTWELTVSTSSPAGSVSYFQSGAVLSDHFAAGMRVRLRRWDSPYSAVLRGEVDSVNDSTSKITVTFDDTWPGVGSHSWVLGYDLASSALTTDQQGYVFLAGTDGRVSFTDAQPARVFAP